MFCGILIGSSVSRLDKVSRLLTLVHTVHRTYNSMRGAAANPPVQPGRQARARRNVSPQNDEDAFGGGVDPLVTVADPESSGAGTATGTGTDAATLGLTDEIKEKTLWADALFCSEGENLYSAPYEFVKKNHYIVQCQICRRLFSLNRGGRNNLCAHAQKHGLHNREQVLKAVADIDTPVGGNIHQHGDGHNGQSSSRAQPQIQPRMELYQPYHPGSRAYIDHKKKTLAFIITCGLPYSLVEAPAFQSLCAGLNRKAPSFSRQLVSREVKRMYDETTSTWKGSGWAQWRPSYTTDLWTAHGKQFLSLTAHWIERPVNIGWRLNTRDIGIRRVTCARSESLANMLKSWMTDLGLLTDAVSVVTDHGSNMGKAIENICGWDWHGCVPHRINIGVKKVLKLGNTTVIRLLHKIRVISKKIRGSNPYWCKFESIQLQLLEERRNTRASSNVHDLTSDRDLGLRRNLSCLGSDDEDSDCGEDPGSDADETAEVEGHIVPGTRVIRLTLDSDESAALNTPVSQDGGSQQPSTAAATVQNPESQVGGSQQPSTAAATVHSRNEGMEDLFRVSNCVLKPQLDVETRWNSVWYMVVRFLRLEKPLTVFLSQNSVAFQELDESDWELLVDIAHALEPYKTVTKILEAEETVTCSLILSCMAYLHKECIKKTMNTEGGTKLLQDLSYFVDKEFDDPEAWTAWGLQQYLDPATVDIQSPTVTDWVWGPDKPDWCYDFIEVRSQFQSRQQWFDSVIRLIGDSCKEVQDRQQSTSSVRPHAVSKKHRPSRIQAFTMCAQATESVSYGNNDIEGQLHSWTALRRTSQAEDTLRWWSINGSRFPLLSTVASEWLCIPASSCSSERMFSKIGHMLGPRRQAMTDTGMEMLSTLKGAYAVKKK